MTKEELNKVKEFAALNFCLPEEVQVFVETEEFNVTNPWMDQSARFDLTDDGAVREWGLDVVVSFIEKVKGAMRG